MSLKTALLVKMSSLGDVVHALPALSDAARHGWQFDWVVEEAFADIPKRHAAVRDVLPVAWRRWRRSLWSSRKELRAFKQRLQQSRYDIVLDSQGLIKSAVVVRLSRAAVSAGFDSESARERLAAAAYARKFSVQRAQHAIDRQRQLFAAALGYELDDSFCSGLARQSAAESRWCVFLHGTTWPSKHYPEAAWQALIERSLVDGYRPVLTWGSDEERQRAERLAAATGAEIWPRLPLHTLIDRLAQTSLVIGVDSGLTHLAAALAVPTVGLYGSTDAVLTGCRGTSAVALGAQFPCAPCMSRSCTYTGPVIDNGYGLIRPACYATLNVEVVWQQAMEQVRAHRLLHI